MNQLKTYLTPIFLAIIVVIGWLFWQQQQLKKEIDMLRQELTSQVFDKEIDRSDVDKYQASVLHTGGLGSRNLQFSAYTPNNSDGYIVPAEDWIRATFNRPADLLWVNCTEGYVLSKCESSTNNDMFFSGEDNLCSMTIENKLQNWVTIECAKK